LYLALVTIAARFSGEFYLTCTIVSLILTLAAIFLITDGMKFKGLAIAVTALLFSKGFIDYSLSGLENPATHLAIAGYLFFYWRKRDPFLLSLMAALAVTNRQDTALFFLPSLTMVYFRTGWRVWRPAALGWSPFIAWSLFSVFYYGFLFPNTAYAKLNIGVTTQHLIHQGVLYLDDAWRWDTATAVVIALGLVVACFVGEWMLCLGILLNLLYVVRVGGDYMTGRFLTGAVFLSAAILARYWKMPAPATAAAVSLVVAAGMSIPSPTIASARADFGKPWPDDPGLFVFDERAWNYPCSGLLRYGKHLPVWPGHLIRPGSVYSVSCTSPPVPNSPPLLWPDAFFARVGEGLSRAGTSTGIYSGVGMIGFFGGPHAHILDDMALGDALIARLPADLLALPGHYRRTVPPGYLETIKTGVNQIVDPGLHEYYDHLRIVISGDLWSMQRIKEIALINLGRYDRLLVGYSKALKKPL
jgi:arabinofuranosyltransferase